MKQHYQKNYLLAYLLTLLAGLTGFAQNTTLTYSFTGSVQTFTVPLCVNQVTVDIRGGQGANAIDKLPNNASGGLGGRTQGVISVSTGQVLYLYVGSMGYTTGVGGYNGGANGGTATAGSACSGGPAGGGGGASDIRIGGTALANRVAVAGGGGGAGRDYCNGSCQPCGCGGSGGCGGGISGGGGQGGWNCGYAYPGTEAQAGIGAGPTGPGSGGTGSNGGANGNNGSLGIGGSGASGQYDIAGGGGGGGYYGGGGGAGASNGSGVGGGGGGGGSGYTGGMASGTTTSCYQTGDGLIVLTYNLNGGSVFLNISSPNNCSAVTSTIVASGMNTYTWSNSSNSPSIVVTPSVTTSYTVTGSNTLGCSGSTVATIQVDNSVPSISLNSNSLAVCQGQSATLTASGASSYTWSGGIANGLSFTPTASAIYTVTGANACGSTTALANVQVNPLPVVTANASNTLICGSNSVTLNGGGASTYSWSGNVSNGIAFTPTVSSVYTVTGANNFACTATAVVAVSVVTFTGTSVSVSPSSSSICVGNSATLSATGVNSYTWNTTATSNQIVVNPLANSVYTVSGTNANGCVSSAAVNITVLSGNPVLALSSNSITVCSGQSTLVTASGASSYTWSGGISNGVAFTPTVSAIYVVNGSNACGTSSISVPLSVLSVPVLTLSASANSVCSGSSLTLSAIGANSYSWSGGVGNNVGFLPSSSGSYSVTGTGSNGCSSSAAIAITVVNTPTLPPVASSASVCAGGSATLSASGAGSYTWLPSNSNNASIVVTPASAVTYTVIKANATCVDTQTISLGVNPLPVITTAAYPGTVCAQTAASLVCSGASTYVWYPGGLSGSQVVVYPNSSNTYAVIANNGTCSASGTLNLSVLPNPVISIQSSTNTICAGDSVNLTAGGTINYNWLPGNFNTNSITVYPSATALYTLVGTDAQGCSTQTTQLIIVNANPIINLLASYNYVCVWGSVTLQANGGGSYAWSTGATGSVITVYPSANTVYSVSGSNPLNSCVSTQTIAITVVSTNISITGITSICVGQTATLQASGANSYVWSTGSPFPGLSVTPTVSTQYSVSGISNTLNLTCQASASVLVTVNPNPTVSISSIKTQLCKGEPLILTASGANTYTWSNAANTSSVVVTSSLVGSFNYSVLGSNSFGCSSSSSVQIKVNSCAGIEEQLAGGLQLEIYPNPNSGAFRISSQQNAELLLISELGQVIKHLELNAANNRTVNIEGLAQGIYFIKAKDNSLSKKIIVTR